MKSSSLVTKSSSPLSLTQANPLTYHPTYYYPTPLGDNMSNRNNRNNPATTPRIVRGNLNNFVVITASGKRIPCHNLATARLELSRNS